MNVRPHKHCVYCGEVMSLESGATAACTAMANPVTVDTVGNKPHVYIEPGWPPPKIQFHRPGKKSTENGRRYRIDLMTPAELAIRAAMLKVEETGCHPLLTDAVVLLDQAKNKVADWIDRQEEG